MIRSEPNFRLSPRLLSTPGASAEGFGSAGRAALVAALPAGRRGENADFYSVDR